MFVTIAQRDVSRAVGVVMDKEAKVGSVIGWVYTGDGGRGK